jgi:hypothetical protein
MHRFHAKQSSGDHFIFAIYPGVTMVMKKQFFHLHSEKNEPQTEFPWPF